MTTTEARSYNQGVTDVLAIITKAADRIGASEKRSALFREIAAAGFHEVADAGRALLLPETAENLSSTPQGSRQ